MFCGMGSQCLANDTDDTMAIDSESLHGSCVLSRVAVFGRKTRALQPQIGRRDSHAKWELQPHDFCRKNPERPGFSSGNMSYMECACFKLLFCVASTGFSFLCCLRLQRPSSPGFRPKNLCCSAGT